jgi:hypothetical protein
LFGPGAIAPIVFEGVGFARRHRADQRVGLGFWRRMRDEPDFRRSVDAWARLLTPLADRVAPVTPPASAWAAIHQQIGGGAPSISRRQSEGVWLEVAPGTTLKMLHVDPVTGERTGLMRMDPGGVYPSTIIRSRRSVSCSKVS